MTTLSTTEQIVYNRLRQGPANSTELAEVLSSVLKVNFSSMMALEIAKRLRRRRIGVRQIGSRPVKFRLAA